MISDWQKLVDWKRQKFRVNMTLDSCFYIECLAIEEWSYFHGWRESMTGIYLTRELGIYHQNIQVSYRYLGELNCNISFLIFLQLCSCTLRSENYAPSPPISWRHFKLRIFIYFWKYMQGVIPVLFGEMCKYMFILILKNVKMLTM